MLALWQWIGAVMIVGKELRDQISFAELVSLRFMCRLQLEQNLHLQPNIPTQFSFLPSYNLTYSHGTLPIITWQTVRCPMIPSLYHHHVYWLNLQKEITILRTVRWQNSIMLVKPKQTNPKFTINGWYKPSSYGCFTVPLPILTLFNQPKSSPSTRGRPR